jgi:uncharacterized protein (DUF58 family)
VRLFPTRSALDVAVAGAAVVLAGILLFQPAIVAWGGALIVGLSIGRAITLLHVARVRGAGFEMVWRGSGRSIKVSRGQPATIFAEVRNRDTRAARYVQLRVIGSPHVTIELEPDSGEVPAGGRLEVLVKVTAQRVGRQGLFGLGLELRGSPGLFEVPLTFSNPFGLEVLPSPAQPGRHSPPASGGVLVGLGSSRRSGDSTEFSEIREYQAGDALKRLAWKASARRGKLMVRKYEVEERDLVWFVLDASVELWAGRVGSAPLDLAIDGVAQLIRQHLRAGHEVGLISIASGVIERVPARRGATHERRLLETLARTPFTLEPDRSGLDERGAALRVLEHLRALVPLEAQLLDPNDLDKISQLAARMLPQSPFPDLRIAAPTQRESALRTHLGAFGIGGPPRLEPRKPETDALLGEAVLSVSRGRPRASVVYIASPMPDEERWKQLWPRLRQVRRPRTRLSWVYGAELPALDTPTHVQAHVARTAARLRADSERVSAEQRLRHVGITTVACSETEAVHATHVEPVAVSPSRSGVG